MPKIMQKILEKGCKILVNLIISEFFYVRNNKCINSKSDRFLNNL